jgi:hypothetical protein
LPESSYGSPAWSKAKVAEVAEESGYRYLIAEYLTKFDIFPDFSIQKSEIGCGLIFVLFLVAWLGALPLYSLLFD